MLSSAAEVLHWSPMDRQAMIGVIGGSGLYELGLLAEAEPLTIHTPYGPHSPGLRIGRIGTTSALFLPRHGTCLLYTSPSPRDS